MSVIAGEFAPLAALLRERRRVIADHAFRDRDAAAHLEALKNVSEALVAEQERLGSFAPPRLRHYLEQRSYDKALLWIEGGTPEGH